MRRTIIEPAALGGAALAALKQWLAITSNAEDARLAALLAAAAELCEGFTGSMPLAQGCEALLQPLREWQLLPARPVFAISGVEGIAATSPRFALPISAYAIDLGADGTGRVRIDDPGNATRVAVRFDAGLASDWDALPASLAQGILALAAQLYRERDNAGPLPSSVAALWQPWRRMRIA